MRRYYKTVPLIACWCSIHGGMDNEPWVMANCFEHPPPVGWPGVIDYAAVKRSC